MWERLAVAISNAAAASCSCRILSIVACALFIRFYRIIVIEWNPIKSHAGILFKMVLSVSAKNARTGSALEKFTVK